jgi:regulator of nucleoside diphosphate kinase
MDKAMAQNCEKQKIEATEFDAKRLKTLIFTARNPKSNIGTWLEKLQLLLENAVLVSPMNIKADTVTMNSKIKLFNKTSKKKISITLVFLATALREINPDFEEFNVTILSPMGLSVFGRKVGDAINGRVIIDEMLYQPEALGDYDL